MESVPCPISNSEEFTPYLQIPDRFDRSGNVRWSLVRSPASGLIMLNPRPDRGEIAEHYRSGEYDPYWHGLNSESLRERAYLAARSLLLRWRAGLIMRGWTKPMAECSVLEIGCSTGDLLNYFHRKGVPIDHLAGVEPDGDAAGYAREFFGLKIFPSVSDKNLGEKTFDRIVLWHTLEHIHDIHETLKLVARQLKPEGVVVLALPNPASYDAEYYGENWVAYDAPRHLYHFWPGTVEKLLALHKLSVFRRLPYFPDFLYNTFYSEVLLSKRQKRRFTVLRMLTLLWRLSLYAVKGGFWPMKASSLIYFAGKESADWKG
ncbi:MAG: class I SAM-dependent methyltransferase [Chlorobiaceae bacterium]